MTLFVLLNWTFCLATAAVLLVIILEYRYLLLKPSVIVLLLFHLRIQWAATFQAAVIEKFLPNPSAFLVLAQGFPLLGILVAYFMAHRSAKELSERIQANSADGLNLKGTIAALLTIIVIISILYFREVPFAQTGLYSIITNPAASAETRESSLKLISNPYVRYSYSFLVNAFAPMLAVLLLLFWEQERRRKNRFLSLSAILVFAYLLFMVSLTGARAPAATLLLTIFLALYLKRGLPLRFSYVVVGFLLILIPPVILTILREGQVINLGLFFQYFRGSIFQRLFVIPMEVGLYHVHYAQTHGLFGIAAIPRLAALAGIQPVNVANLIYSTYYNYPLASGIANTSYVFSYYSYFGILSFFFSLGGLWVLDSTLWILKKIRNTSILLACLAALLTSSLAFVSADYTIVLLTNGFLLIVLIGWLMDRISRIF
jgi:hypothetical protein